jgi:phage terminase large subunit-like protein
LQYGEGESGLVTRGLDGRRKSAATDSPGPWTNWPETERADRAIRFIESYCRPPKGYGHGQPMRLAAFQKEWLRRVLRAGVSSAVLALPRGNGKSSLLAAFALWALFDPEPSSGAPQVPVVATVVHQAIRTTYGVALAMTAAEPTLGDRCIPYTGIGATKLFVPTTGGEMFPIANTAAGLQGLDVSVAVVDEIGFMPLDSWNALLMAGTKRPHSLVVGIGTPGFDQDNALWSLRQKWLENRAPAGFDFDEYAADDGCRIDDEDQWARANPALAAGFMNVDVLRTNLALAPEGRFRLFHLGQWVDGVESWLGDDGRRLWDSLRDPYEFEAA